MKVFLRERLAAIKRRGARTDRAPTVVAGASEEAQSFDLEIPPIAAVEPERHSAEKCLRHCGSASRNTTATRRLLHEQQKESARITQGLKSRWRLQRTHEAGLLLMQNGEAKSAGLLSQTRLPTVATESSG